MVKTCSICCENTELLFQPCYNCIGIEKMMCSTCIQAIINHKNHHQICFLTFDCPFCRRDMIYQIYEDRIKITSSKLASTIVLNRTEPKAVHLIQIFQNHHLKRQLNKETVKNLLRKYILSEETVSLFFNHLTIHGTSRWLYSGGLHPPVMLLNELNRYTSMNHCLNDIKRYKTY